MLLLITLIQVQRTVQATCCASSLLLISSIQNEKPARERTPRAACSVLPLCLDYYTREKEGQQNQVVGSQDQIIGEKKHFYPTPTAESQTRSCY